VWYGAATDALELMLGTQIVALPCNVVVIAHVNRKAETDDDKSLGREEFGGKLLWHPEAPGRLANAQGLGAGYGEMYYFEIVGVGKEVSYRLRSRPTGQYNCNSTVLNVPNGIVDPTYEKLWTNYEKKS
jgi:hypothetical protein